MVKKNYITVAFLLAFLSVYFLSIAYSILSSIPSVELPQNDFSMQMNSSVSDISGAIGAVPVLLMIGIIIALIMFCSGTLMGRGME